MQRRTQSTQCASTRWIRWITVVYTSLGLSGCKSNQDVIAFDRSCSPRFTTTYTETRCHIQLIRITPVPKHYTMSIKFHAFQISALDVIQWLALAAFSPESIGQETNMNMVTKSEVLPLLAMETTQSNPKLIDWLTDRYHGSWVKRCTNLSDMVACINICNSGKDLLNIDPTHFPFKCLHLSREAGINKLITIQICDLSLCMIYVSINFHYLKFFKLVSHDHQDKNKISCKMYGFVPDL